MSCNSHGQRFSKDCLECCQAQLAAAQREIKYEALKAKLAAAEAALAEELKESVRHENEAIALRAKNTRLEESLAAAEEANASVAVCRSHTGDVTKGPCLVCETEDANDRAEKAEARVKELEQANGRGYGEWKAPWNDKVNELTARITKLEVALSKMLALFGIQGDNVADEALATLQGR
jgi:chromosome segregation ATPase